MKDLKQAIQNTLAVFNPETLRASSISLLETLGYASDRFPSLPDESPETFIATIEELSGQTLNRDKALVGEWVAADILFQMQDSDIRQAGSGQLELFDSSGIFDGKAMESYVFAAVRLRSPHYTRTDLAQITRAVNRLFPMPVIILFVHGETVTLAIIERRLNKKDSNKDVLEKVTQIKDIRLRNPHRAHVEILNDLALPVLSEKHECHSFVQLHEAWRKTLDTNELNKKFYRELADWYFWALGHVDFPDDVEKDTATRKATCVIRLLTRLIFCWFLKEKGLIPEHLFSERKLKGLLKSLDAADSSFYLAILQNLFFGTLNQRMNAGGQDFRRFAREGGLEDNKEEYGVKNLYRYQSLYAIPQADALKLFEDIPFLNGGLFDCLDKEDEKGKVLYVDGFTRNPKKRPTVPNFLFFSDYQTLDLSDAYGDNRRKNEKVRGLIHLLDSYKFTVTENTPIDEEIALDPELLGKVFENLLASYNPETGTTARKQTGSFYTPREIVNYMVDESLKAYIEQKVAQTFLSAESPESQTGMSVPPSVVKTRRNLPHWHKDGSIYWVNFRLADSLPQSKLRAWKEERDIWKQHHPEPWSEDDWAEYDERFGDKLEAWLDAGMGACALARKDVREAVQNCLCKFDGERLHLHAAVIMPNHIHALIEPVEGHDLSKLLKGIKGAAAREANKLLGTTGTFWLEESYDHIVRSQKQYEHFLRYIDDNPVKAKLPPANYWLHKGSTDIPVCGSSSLPSSSQTGMSALPSESQTRMSVLLSQLFSYSDTPVPFDDQEVDALIDAIDASKILDPACGSGAFPMGILHKLVFILGKLDPGNVRWKQRQLDKLDSAPMREELERTFRDNDDDYGRKLYLIENCIYGVDIQPIAIQISKLRFFISLLCDQRTNRDKAKNCGVRPLPNLETKFVAANTLISLDKGQNNAGQMLLFDQRLPKLEAELKAVRHKHFAAQRRKDKLDLQKKDCELRKQIAAVLADGGMSAEASRQLAAWDPYDQNISAPFFDPEWMFGISDGVDVVIGNPPYVQIQKLPEDAKVAYGNQGFATFARTADLYCLFYELGSRVLVAGGFLFYISSNKFMRAGYGKALRHFFATRTTIKQLVDFGELPVFEAGTDPCILLYQNADFAADAAVTIAGAKTVQDIADVPALVREHGFTCRQSTLTEEGWTLERPGVIAILDKLKANGTPLGELVGGRFYYGIKTGFNEAFVIDQVTRDRLIAEDPRSAEVIKPWLRGQDIKRWHGEWHDLYLIFTRRGINISDYPAIEAHLSQFKNDLKVKLPGEIGRGRKPGSYEWFEIQDNIAYYEDFSTRKFIYPDIAKLMRGFLDCEGYFSGNTTYFIPDATPVLAACLNSRIFDWYARHNFQALGDPWNSGRLRFFSQYMQDVPIPPADSATQAEVDRLVSALQQEPIVQTEAELDARVAHLYSLTESEYRTILANTNTPDDFQAQALEWFGKLDEGAACLKTYNVSKSRNE
ncbi:MAG: transposase [Lentisphaeria bacterium]|nr:transposase [Lentisphaeria bacterium]